MSDNVPLINNPLQLLTNVNPQCIMSIPANLENFLMVIENLCEHATVSVSFENIDEMKETLNLVSDAIIIELLPPCHFEEYFEQGKVFLVFKTGIIIFKVRDK